MRTSLYTDVYPLFPRGHENFTAFRNHEHKYDFFDDDWIPSEWATPQGDDSTGADGIFVIRVGWLRLSGHLKLARNTVPKP